MFTSSLCRPLTCLDLRPYSDFIFTSSDDEAHDENLEFKVISNALLLGAKVSLYAPTYISPYTEVGLGASLDSLNTFTLFADIEKKGGSIHIPFMIGLAIVQNHGFEFEIVYYFHSDEEQFSRQRSLVFRFLSIEQIHLI
ncbi:hypothetical protein ACJD0Z_18050 [Flavobacteriaceae bacterium M23B6Z8]